MAFFLETTLGGLMAGVLYSVVALGFVLIFKASGVFNFAQGAMVLFAALAMARFSEWVPAWLGFESLLLANIIAFVLAAMCMLVFAWLVERLVLRHLVNQEAVTLLMATLGITYFLDGFGQTIFGSAVYRINVGMPKEPIFVLDNLFQGGLLVNKEDLIAALIAATLVGVLSLFFQKTTTGRALRAVADDHQAAQSIGIPLNRMWVIVWFVAGITALVAGIIWGSKIGVQFSLTTVALKALPVIILGGIHFGVFTPTEASAAAVLYAVIVGKFVYGTLQMQMLPAILYRTALMSASILFIVATSAVFAWVLTVGQIPQQVAGWIAAMELSPFTLLLAINILLLLVGIFIEPLPGVMIMVPILAPLADGAGLDPLHFAIVVIVNLTLGMVTPPVGGLLFVTSVVSGVRMGPMMKEAKPMLIALLIVLLMLTYLPQLSIWLPNTLGYPN